MDHHWAAGIEKIGLHPETDSLDINSKAQSGWLPGATNDYEPFCYTRAEVRIQPR